MQRHLSTDRLNACHLDFQQEELIFHLALEITVFFVDNFFPAIQKVSSDWPFESPCRGPLALGAVCKPTAAAAASVPTCSISFRS